jgi:hypothetical protein
MVEGLENVDCEMTRLRRPLKLGSRGKVRGASDLSVRQFQTGDRRSLSKRENRGSSTPLLIIRLVTSLRQFVSAR